MAQSSADGPAAAMAAALVPYTWRGFTDRMLARRVIAAVDRHDVLRFLSAIPGTDIGIEPAVEPADAGDDRVDVLVSALTGRRWRMWSLARLCVHVISSLEAWQAAREVLESDLRRLLEGH